MVVFLVESQLQTASLKIGDIDFERRLMIVKGKGHIERVVPISKVAKEFLLLYLGERIKRSEELLFCGMTGRNISRTFRTYLRKFGMDRVNISTHSVRHSTATHLLENGANIRHVQELLGHKNIENTVRYTHLESENLFKIFRKYHPRKHQLFEVVDDAYIERFNT